MPSSTEGQTITCKAAVAWKAKEPLVIQDVQVAPPEAGEVRVKVTHTSLCHTDLFFWENEGCFPRILGHEAAGIVESVGEEVTDLEEGDHVVLLFNGECGRCKQCKSEKTNLCAKLKVDASRSTMRIDEKCRFTTKGGQPIHHFLNVSSFCEYTVVEAGCAAKIDPSTPLNRACLFACGVPTGIGAVRNVAKVEKGSSVVIFGLGSVGFAVAEGARIAEAKQIIGIDVNPKKFDIAKDFGVTDFINPRDLSKPIEDVVKEMTNGGADYCFECVGNVDLVLAAFESCHEGWGRTVLLGVEVRPVTLNMHPMKLFDGKEIKGSTFGDYKGKSHIPNLISLYKDKSLDVDKFVTHELAFDKINEAFKLLMEGKSLRTVLHLNDL
ncbi:hypothetical protein GOP47_0000488 [Adiantum capillus-veneris]|uniref:Enoyl reductase (ER) domain-containing protein n=1 Tax=Adiantum capillus-veneris TaxID=13818 RepID=A0A9D4VDZ9_ADICA|nr:hypothetical protein GOP47_0000488 [Adiantum capillus-veneris]